MHIGQSLDFVEGKGKKITIDNKSYAVFRHNGELGCVDNVCPHASGELCAGPIDKKGQITCPNHNRLFDFQTGKGGDDNVNGYRIWEENGQVYIDVTNPWERATTVDVDALVDEL